MAVIVKQMRNESQNTTRNGGGVCYDLHVQLASNKQATALEHFARCLKIDGESLLASLLFTLTSWLY